MQKRYKIDGHKYVKTARRTKKQIQDLIETQPLTCSITAYASLHAHSGEGIYMGPTEKELEEAATKPVGSHALLLVGYGRENGEDFYLVQNSWGAKWGHKGFAKIKRSLITGLYHTLFSRKKRRMSRRKNWCNTDLPNSIHMLSRKSMALICNFLYTDLMLMFIICNFLGLLLR